MYRLYQFVRRDGDLPDFIVISDDKVRDIRAEYENDTWNLNSVLEIDGDADDWPCDRRLTY